MQPASSLPTFQLYELKFLHIEKLLFDEDGVTCFNVS